MLGLHLPALLVLSASVQQPTLAKPGKVVLLTLASRAAGRYLPAAEERLHGELAALGFEVERAAGDAVTATERRLELVAIAAARRAQAVMRLVRLGRAVSIELWVADRSSGKMRFRTVGGDRKQGGAEASARAVALAAVELLNAMLLDLGIDLPGISAAPPDEALPADSAPPSALAGSLPGGPPTSASAPRGAMRPFALAAGAWCMYATGGMGSVGGPGLTAYLQLGESIAFRADLAGAVVGGRTERPAASARLRVLVTRLQAVYTPLAMHALSPELGAGAALLGLEVSGHAEPPLVGSTARAGVGLVTFSAGLRARLGEAAAVLLTGALGYSSKSYEVYFGDRAAAEIRSPFMDLGVALLWSW